jgi:hypothetical protein
MPPDPRGVRLQIRGDSAAVAAGRYAARKVVTLGRGSAPGWGAAAVKYPGVSSRRVETEIDRLYQLPPADFTAARNALAKEAGADGAGIRALAKPPLAAWAVNQVYWKRRDVYDALIAASNDLRKLHKAVLSGRHADIREAGRTHDAAVDAALKAAIAILRDDGHPATDATRQAIVTTLRALPSDESPGRLTRTLQPGGFEMLAGLSIAGTRPRTDTDAHGERARGKAQVHRLRDAEAAIEKGPTAGKANAPVAPVLRGGRRQKNEKRHRRKRHRRVPRARRRRGQYGKPSSWCGANSSRRRVSHATPAARKRTSKRPATPCRRPSRR